MPSRIKVQLTARGKLVGWVEIPPFLTGPDVLIWGDRTFRQVGGDPRTYDECFAYTIVDQVSGS